MGGLRGGNSREIIADRKAMEFTLALVFIAACACSIRVTGLFDLNLQDFSV
jgi:hypothetical protein